MYPRGRLVKVGDKGGLSEVVGWQRHFIIIRVESTNYAQ